MKRNYSREEIEELILSLSSDDEEMSDLAMSAFMIANPNKHLPDLVNALNYSDDSTRQRICYILGGIPDERCVDPLLSVLQDENLDTRLVAIDSLQYFPDERIIPHLKNQFKVDEEEIRKAAISTLGAFIKYGIPVAHLPLIEIVQDENEILELRLLSFKYLSFLEQEQLKQILETLKEVSDASIYSQILMLENELDEDVKQQKIIKVEQLIEKLLIEEDILRRIRLEDQLVEFGGLAAKVLIKLLFKAPKNSMLRIYTRTVFEKLGYKTIPAFKSLFETFNQFDDIYKVFLLQDIITLVAHRQYAALTQSLLKLLDNINAFIKAKNSGEVRKGFVIIKSDIHLALAKYGSRDAIDDVKAMIDDGTKRQYIPLIEAIEYIGDKNLLIPLINQYHAYRNFKTSKTIIKKAFRAIVKREHIKRNDPIFKNLSELQKKNLRLISKKRR